MRTSVTLATVAHPGQATEQLASPVPSPVPLRPARVRPHSLTALAALVGRQLHGAPVDVTGVSSNSAQVCAGDLFAALPGSTGHGISYADAAVRAGAVAVLTDAAGAEQLSRHRRNHLPVLVAPDPRAVLGPVASAVYGDPSQALTMLGVTGTSGKTTTTFLVRAGLAAAGLDTGLVGTVGIFIGPDSVKTPFTTPEAPELQALLAVMVERGISHVPIEVSSHALAQGRVNGTQFAVGAFTNLSQDHLDYHHDMAEYFAAKALLFDGRARREVIVIDDEWGPQLVTPDSVTVSGTGLAADWTARDLVVASDGATTFTVGGPGLHFAAGCRIPGSYNVANTLLALAILHQAGVDPAAVAPALARAQVPGRMERVDGPQPFLVVIDYSHKPAGVTGALRALRPLTAARLIIVLGCGGDRDRGKRPIMGEVAARAADVLIVTDDNPRSEDPAAIRSAMLAGARSVPTADAAEILEMGDRRAAIEHAVAMAGPGDTVLVAGKGHETGQAVGGVLLPFDDVTVARHALGELQ